MRLSTVLFLGSLALAAPAAAIADNTAPSATPATAAAPADQGWGKHHRLSAETIQHLQDGRIAYIAAALDLTDAQKPLWTPVADLLRQQAADRMHQAKPAAERPSDLSDILAHHANRMEQRATADKQLADALKALEAKLTPEQKTTLRVAFFSSMPHHFGRMGPTPM